MIAAPNNYEIRPGRFHKYLEPHTPDLIVTKETQGDADGGFTSAVLVVEVASYEKANGTNLKRFEEQSVEQNLQQTLAAMSCNQDLITGLVIFPDGLKLTQITKERQCYNVKETEVIRWGDADLFRLLECICQSI